MSHASAEAGSARCSRRVDVTAPPRGCICGEGCLAGGRWAAGRAADAALPQERWGGSPGAAGRGSAFCKTSQRTGEEGIAAASPADGTWLGSVLFLQAVTGGANGLCSGQISWKPDVQIHFMWLSGGLVWVPLLFGGNFTCLLHFLLILLGNKQQ